MLNSVLLKKEDTYVAIPLNRVKVSIFGQVVVTDVLGAVAIPLNRVKVSIGACCQVFESIYPNGRNPLKSGQGFNIKSGIEVAKDELTNSRNPLKSGQGFNTLGYRKEEAMKDLLLSQSP